jgi:D-xylose 1-dehydrogenase (NADP+, D-xylono-1,5-lactone-forming)
MSLRWGLLSTARINDKLLATGRERFVAVASRSAERAQDYAREHGIARAHGSYKALLADEDVDAIYLSLPNGLHVEWTLRALAAGKHVLCEKPLAASGEQAERCFDAAEAAGLVLSEGFMWRHHPQAARLAALVAEGRIGRLALIRAVFSFPLGRPEDPRWDPELEGGALADVGCYCVSGARMLGGEPERVHAEAVRAPSGVDVRFAAVMRFPADVLATFDCGLDVAARDELEVVGSAGSLFLDDPWHGRDPVIELRPADEPAQRIELPRVDPYGLELDDLEAAAAGERAPLLGREDAVGQARALEALRHSASEGTTVAVTA